MALVHRLRTGQGQFVEVPMFEVLVSFNLVEHINGAAFEPPIGPLGYQRVTTPARRPFPTKDGHVCILPYSDKQWLSFFTAVGPAGADGEPGFATYSARVHTVDELYGFVASVTPEKTNAEWVEICERGEIPCMPVADIQALMDDEHLKAVGMFERAPSSERGRDHPGAAAGDVHRVAGRHPATRAELRRAQPRGGARARLRRGGDRHAARLGRPDRARGVSAAGSDELQSRRADPVRR